ncbi:MAG TPA: hypothetical protein VLV83_25400 [Acidobacteriota bacterium]|nr:hypothetical protein [Acidobacteriota bacterium]
MTKLRQFVERYSEHDATAVRFAWNGKHGDDLKDDNADFRDELLGHFLDHKDSFPVALLRDLYDAETAYAREAWVIDLRVGKLAQEMLIRDGKSSLDVYAKGLIRSMDTYATAGRIDLPEDLRRTLAEECAARIARASSVAERKSYQAARDVFSK